MKPSALTQSRLRRQTTVSVSLFPFLVVLISIMGALILLLVIIARQARLQAAAEAAPRSAALRKQIGDARQWAKLAIDEYQYARKKTESQLAEARLALGHVEDHARRLAEQLARLQATWHELESLRSAGSGRREAIEAALRQVEERTAQAQRELAQARQEANKRRSYAVVPYEGPNGTFRRPIYIECRADAVVLQPEKVLLRAEDFDGPLGPGNPLEVALRAVREHLIRQQALDPTVAGEPYPLLLVRPSGIEAYYAARAAMQSWSGEFGYELVEDDWELEFPPPSPQLALEVQQAVATARVRQARLMAAAPQRFASRQRGGYVAAPTRGGLIARGSQGGTAPGAGEAKSSGYRAARASDRVGSRYAPWDAGREETPPGAAPGIEADGRDEGPGAADASDQPEDAGEKNTTKPAGPIQVTLGASDRPRCLAKVRGRNWALSNAVQGAVAVNAPVRIDCYPDRLELIPEPGLGRVQVIPLGPRTEDAVDALLAAVWDYHKRWGSAGRGMYWRPVLSLHVKPGAETRYRDLETLLEGSGLGVERKDEG